MYNIEVEILSGRRELRQAMATTQGKRLSKNCKPLSDKGMEKAILSQHGSLDRYIFRVRATVPDRVHTHLRTHELVNDFYQCSTSRPDWTDSNKEYREIDFNLPMLRAIEIAGLRTCTRAWHETQKFYVALLDELYKIEPVLKVVCAPRCVQYGVCHELDKCCGFIDTEYYETMRNKYVSSYKKYRKGATNE